MRSLVWLMAASLLVIAFPFVDLGLGQTECHDFQDTLDHRWDLSCSNVSWIWQSDDGHLRSGTISNVNNSSSVCLNFEGGRAVVNFTWMKTSNLKSQSEFKFYINDEIQETYTTYDNAQNKWLRSQEHEIHGRNGDNVELKWVYKLRPFGGITKYNDQYAFGAIDDVCITPIPVPCEVNAPDLEIFQGDQLSQDLFYEKGVRCTGGCTQVVDYSSVNPQWPGNYTYTATCDGDPQTSRIAGLRVTPVSPPCEVTAPDLEVFQGYRLSPDFFNQTGVSCSRGCAAVVNSSSVDVSVPGSYPYEARCDPGRAMPATGRIRVISLEIHVPQICVGQPEEEVFEASVTELRHARYSWSITGGEIKEGRNTSRVLWTSGDGNTTLGVRVDLFGVEESLSQKVPVDPRCIYLCYDDDVNATIENDTEIRLLCESHNGRTCHEGTIEIEGKNDLVIRSACQVGERPRLEGVLKMGNSTNITVDGLEIAGNDDAPVQTDNLIGSKILNNSISSRNNAIIYLYYSYNNRIAGNEIAHLVDRCNSITLYGGHGNTIDECLDDDHIHELIFANNGTSLYDITCFVHPDCYTCNLTDTDKIVDIRDYSNHTWGDLSNFQEFCNCS